MQKEDFIIEKGTKTRKSLTGHAGLKLVTLELLDNRPEDSFVQQD